MFWVCRLGQTDYLNCLKLQEQLRQKRIIGEIPNLLLLTSHLPVFTTGKRDCSEDFLSSQEKIHSAGISIFPTERGGKITYHGPGQIVGYLIVELASLRQTIPGLVRTIERAILKTLFSYGLEGRVDPEFPGVWIENRKIAALGLHFQRGVSTHGFALNVDPDLSHYSHIVPCGIRGRAITSFQKEFGQKITTEEMENQLLAQWRDVFETELREVSRTELLSVFSKSGDFC